MVYCRKCARLLDEDVRFCPYCNDEDKEFVEQPQTNDILEKLNNHVGQRQSVEPPPTFGSVEPTAPTRAYGPVKPTVVEPVDEKPSAGLFACMILLAVFVNVAGLVVGLVMMTKKSPAYRKMGLIMIIVAVASLFLSGLCCCIGIYLSEYAGPIYY